MKLYSLRIGGYKLFEDLEVGFQDSGHFSVFIGKNGSGKTTLIEVLTKIFAGLLGSPDFKALENLRYDFSFSIVYLLRKERVFETTFLGESYVNYIVVEVGFSEQLRIKLFEGSDVIEGVVNIEKYLRSKGEDLKYIFPDNFVVYYSGISNSIFEIFENFQKNILSGALTGEIKFDQPFYYFLPQDLPSVLIGLLSYEYGSVPEILRNRFEIYDFKEILLHFKKPSWAKPKSGAKGFWGAMGELYQFMNILEGNSKGKYTSDSITFAITSKSELEGIWSFYGTEKRLFEYLVSLQANGFLTSIDIKLNKAGEVISCQNLSEGEKQLLVISGLKELLAAENSLFLLDEPDTYLHPSWKREFVFDLFKEYDSLKSYSLITTHSPNILSALHKGQLNILINENGKSRLKQIGFNPYGKPVDELLIDFFDIDSLRFKEVQEQLDDLWAMIKANTFDSDLFGNKFNKLEKDLGKDDKALTEIKLEVSRRSKINEKNK